MGWDGAAAKDGAAPWGVNSYEMFLPPICRPLLIPPLLPFLCLLPLPGAEWSEVEHSERRHKKNERMRTSNPFIEETRSPSIVFCRR
mmetsp:Transcript_19644/g.39816  ORF Transcript_19644/g.39816 Transcript_19644/m.39816 type:complete len:87 (-) Transcript_19644:51-311(-)